VPLSGRSWGASATLAALGGLLALYLLGPLVAFAVRAAQGLPTAPGAGSALATSLCTATISAAAIALLGVPLAYLLARAPAAISRPLTALVALPLALPPLMSGLLLLYVVGPYTWLGRVFDGRLTDTAAGIVLAQTFVAAPFLVIAARAAFAAVDPALAEVAASLGHGPLSRFRRVAIPAALPGIAAGLLLAWLRAFGEFGATVILAYHPYSLPVFTFVQFDSTGLPGTKLPIAVALGAALLVLAIVQLPLPARRLVRRARSPAGARAPAALPGTASPPEAPPGGAALPGGAPEPAAPPGGVSQPEAPGGGAPKPEALPGGAPQFELSARAGEFSLELAHRGSAPRLALLGVSGAGKTLTLRSILGTHRGARTSVRVGGSELGGLPPERRRIGYVPQQPVLLPRRTVVEQVLLGTRAREPDARRWIEDVGLEGLEDRYPHELSGGQQRRVALARALADRPRLLLLDEPFTGLDASARRALIERLRDLQQRHGLSTVLVTHDPQEALLLADEIVVVDGGRELQAGSPRELFRAPAGGRTAELLGIRNVHHGTVLRPGVVASRGVELHADTAALAPGTAVIWSVAPENVLPLRGAPHLASVLISQDLGYAHELRVSLAEGLELTARLPGSPGEPWMPGGRIEIELDPAHVRVWEDREAARFDG
jgi:molybdate transport system permease protein